MTHRAHTWFPRLLVGCGLLLLALCPLWAHSASAKGEVDRAEPAVEETVAVSPERIAIWFTEPLADDPGAITVHLIDGTGALQPLDAATIYAVDARHVSVPIPERLAAGPYSVLWTARFAGPEVEQSGAYGFRLGPDGESAVLPGSDAFPAFWVMLARGLTLIGLALALGGLIFARTESPRGASPNPDRGRRLLILGGGALALIATVAEPVFSALLSVPSPPLATVLAGSPAAWWPRAGALLVLTAVSFTMLVRTGRDRRTDFLWFVAVLTGAIALVATCGSGVAIQRTDAGATTIVIVVVIQAVMVLLAGVALQRALLPSDAADPPAAIRPPAAGPWLTLALAAAALAGTIVLGGLVLPGAVSIVGGRYGQVLIVTGLILLAILLLGLVIRRRAPAAGRWGLALLAVIGLVSASTLALLAPSSVAALPASLVAVNIVDPVPLTVAGEAGLVHLQYQPATPGVNAIVVWLTTADGVTPITADQPGYAIELQSLSGDPPPILAETVPVAASPFAIAAANLSDAGWWRATVTVTPAAGEPATADFFLLVPDPNVSGYGPQPPSSAAARDVFDRGLKAMTALRQVRFTIQLGGGGGTFARSEITINDGSDGSTRGYQEQASGYETVIVGDQQWVRFDNEEWSERQAGYIYVPADWGETYTRATGFALGPVVAVDGEPSQVVTFWLPRQESPRQEPAWFAWWVGTETGQVHRETMISNRHYMVYTFAGFNEPVEIIAPDGVP